MDAAGFDRVDVVGNSMGGWCALELARRGRARSVVAIAPVGMHTNQQGLTWVSQFSRGRDLARRTSRISAMAMASPMLRCKALTLLTERGDRVPAALARALGRPSKPTSYPNSLLQRRGPGDRGGRGNRRTRTKLSGATATGS